MWFHFFSSLSILTFTACPWVCNVHLQLIQGRFQITVYCFTGSVSTLYEYSQIFPPIPYNIAVIHSTNPQAIIFKYNATVIILNILLSVRSITNKKTNSILSSFIPSLTLFLSYVNLSSRLISFPFFLRKVFSISCWAGLLVTNSFNFCLTKSLFPLFEG